MGSEARHHCNKSSPQPLSKTQLYRFQWHTHIRHAFTAAKEGNKKPSNNPRGGRREGSGSDIYRPSLSPLDMVTDVVTKLSGLSILVIYFTAVHLLRGLYRRGFAPERVRPGCTRAASAAQVQEASRIETNRCPSYFLHRAVSHHQPRYVQRFINLMQSHS